MNGDSCPYRHSREPEAPPAPERSEKPQQQSHAPVETGRPAVQHGRRPREALLSAPLPEEEPAKKWPGRRRGSSPVKQGGQAPAQEKVEKPIITPPAPTEVISPEEAEARRRRLEKFGKPLPISKRRPLSEPHESGSVSSQPPAKKQAVLSNDNTAPEPAPAPAEKQESPKPPEPKSDEKEAKTEPESKPPPETEEDLDNVILDELDFTTVPSDPAELEDVEGLLDD